MRYSNLNLALAAALSLALHLSPANAAEPKPKAEALEAVLKSGASRKEKADACRELAVFGRAESIPVLLPLLTDEEMSHMARYALENIPGPAVDAGLREALGKARGLQLVGVVASLGVRRDANAVQPLSQLLSNSDRQVAEAAARALGDIGTEPAAEALEKAYAGVPAASQLAFSDALLRCAEHLARDGQTKRAADLYAKVEASGSPDHQVRSAALRGLLLTSGSKAPALMQEALRGQDFVLFMTALRASHELKGGATTRLLADELAKLPPDRQIVAAQTLGKRLDPTALPALETAARTGSTPVRLAAIRALAEIGNPSSAPTLAELMGASEAEVSKEAQEALASLPGTQVDLLASNLLTSGDVSRHLKGLELVSRRRMTSALPAMFKDTTHENENIRAAAYRNLGELAGPADIPALADALVAAKNAGDLESAEQALSAVCQRAEDSAKAAGELSQALAKADPEHKAALLRVFGSMGSPAALEAVRGALASNQPAVRAAAVRTLSGWQDPKVAPELLKLARATEDPTERMLLLRGYLRIAGSPDLPEPERLGMCKEASRLANKTDEKKLLLGTLGGLNSMEAFTMTMDYLDDADVKAEAGASALNIAERLLKGDDAAAHAAKLAQPLEQIGKQVDSLAGRASRLAEEARKKRS